MMNGRVQMRRPRRRRPVETISKETELKIKRCIVFILLIAAIILYYYYVIKTSIPEVEEPAPVFVTACPTRCILTAEPRGGSGNVIFEFMSLLALARMHSDLYDPFVPRSMKWQLDMFFEPVDMSLLDYLPTNCNKEEIKLRITNDESVEEMVERTLTENATHVILDQYAARYFDILRFGLENMRNEMKFRPEFEEHARKTVEDVRQRYTKGKKIPIVVGVHFRGTDYMDYLAKTYHLKRGQMARPSFYVRAMEYFVRKYKNVVFVMISNDVDWLFAMRKYFLKFQVVFNPNHRHEYLVEKDLAVLSHSDHNIISYGTFATFAALYSGGETIAFDLDLPVDGRGATVAMGISMILGHWQLMYNDHHVGD